MSITPPPFTYEPIAQITPFTYREGATLMSIVRRLKDWSIKLGPQVQQIIDDAVAQFAEELSNAKQSWQESFDQFMENVFNELKAMNDPVVAGLINDMESETREAIQTMLTQETRPLVYELVAEAIANDSTIVDSAVEALNDALELIDVITGSDPRALRTLSPDVRWAIPFTDENGEISAGFNKRGEFETVKVPVLSGDFIRGIDPRSMVQLSPDSPWAFAVADNPGNVIMGVKKSGEFFVSGGSSSSARTMVAAKGDSLVRGYTNSTIWPMEDSWPYLLNQMLDGVTVSNAGYGGRTIDEIRFHVGEEAFWVDSVNGGVIPASGSVPVTVKRKFGLPQTGERVFYGSLMGVNGNLTHDGYGNWSFLRSAAGEAVSAPGSMILKRPVLYPSATSIIWAGRNDFNYDVKGNEASVLEHCKSSMLEWINSLPGNNPQFAVVSVVNRSAEGVGTAGYEGIIAFNEWLAETFPGRYIDVRSWMVNNAIYELGLEPTAADLAAMANDAPPPSIMDGGSHYTKPVAPLLAEIFKDWLVGKGYV